MALQANCSESSEDIVDGKGMRMATLECKNCGSVDHLRKTAASSSPSMVALSCSKCGHKQTCSQEEWDQYVTGVSHAALLVAVGDFLNDKATATLDDLERRISRWDSLSDKEKAQIKADAQARWRGAEELSLGALDERFMTAHEKARLKDIQERWSTLRTGDAVAALDKHRTMAGESAHSLEQAERRRVWKDAKSSFRRHAPFLTADQAGDYRRIIHTLRSAVTPRWWEFWLK